MADGYALAEHSKSHDRDYSAWITWKISHFNWLRFTYRYSDFYSAHDEPSNDYHEFILQWVMVLGSHAHGLDW